MTGSRALIADALHSGADILCALLGIWGRKISGRPIDKTHPYGYGKIEFMVGIIVGLVLAFVAAKILYSSLRVLFLHTEINPPRLLAFWVALLSVYSNFVVSHYTMCAARELNSPALKSISIDNRSDAISSIPVVFCILGSQFGFPQLDPIAAALVGLVIFKMGAGLIIENYHGLMDVSVGSDLVREIRKIILSSPGVRRINYLRTRQSGQQIWIDVEVFISARETLEKASAVSRNIRVTLMRKLNNIGNVQVSLKPLES